MLPHDLLDILACPACKGKLQADETHQHLLCGACALAFPVRSGIPVLLLEEALPAATAGRSDAAIKGRP